MFARKIIILEDIYDLIKNDDSFLGRSGMKIFQVRSNRDVLELHRLEKADLIITHLDMQDITGDSLCSTIRSDPVLRDVSIILVCPDSEGYARRSMDCGANAFITTPLNTAVLLQETYRLIHIAARRTCRAPIRLQVTGTAKTENISGHAENISSSGMLFATAAVLGEGDQITCSFSLPDYGRISTKADIVRVVENKKDIYIYGVAFTDPTKKTLSTISAFVDEHCQDLVEGLA